MRVGVPGNWKHRKSAIHATRARALGDSDDETFPAITPAAIFDPEAPISIAFPMMVGATPGSHG